jgi:hypothetical protein
MLANTDENLRLPRGINETSPYPYQCANQTPGSKKAEEWKCRSQGIKPETWCRFWKKALSVLCLQRLHFIVVGPEEAFDAALVDIRMIENEARWRRRDWTITHYPSFG